MSHSKQEHTKVLQQEPHQDSYLTPNQKLEQNDHLNDQGSFAGQLLLATPDMRDPRFARSVMLLCQHNAAGAMGIIINKPLPKIPFQQLIKQFNLVSDNQTPNPPVCFGGPLESSRGFVLHSEDYHSAETVNIHPNVYLTSSVDIVKQIVHKQKPERYLIALGYAGWDAGQLEGEFSQNSWLVAKTSPEILFDTPFDDQWTRAYQTLGLSPGQYISHSGLA